MSLTKDEIADELRKNNFDFEEKQEEINNEFINDIATKIFNKDKDVEQLLHKAHLLLIILQRTNSQTNIKTVSTTRIYKLCLRGVSNLPLKKQSNFYAIRSCSFVSVSRLKGKEYLMNLVN